MSPSTLEIKISALQRLVKDDAYYKAELNEQKNLVSGQKALLAQDPTDENLQYELKKNVEIFEETKKMFPELKKKISATTQSLKEYIKKENVQGEELAKAQQVINSAETVMGS